MPNKQGVLIDKGVRNKLRNLIDRGSDFEKRLQLIVKRWKEEQAVRKHKTEIYTEAYYFALKTGRK